MKTFIIFFMAFTAINAFFLSNNAREELYQEIERIFSSPPVKFSELMRAIEAFHSISEEERGALINYLFGVRYPRPVPASHFANNYPYDEEKLKEIHEKWESMTPEEREEVRNNRRKDFDSPKPDFIHRFPRDHFNEEKFKEIQEKWESMTPEEREEFRNNRDKEHHFRDRGHFNEEKFKEIQEKWESMTPEEREKFHNRFLKDLHGHHIKDFDHFDKQKMEELRIKWEAMTPEEREELKRTFRKDHGEIRRHSGRSFQAIKPLPEYINDPDDFPNFLPIPNFRQGDDLGHPGWNHRPFPTPEIPIARPEDDIGRISEWNLRPFPNQDWFVRPLPDRVLYPSDGDFQPIMPLNELENSMIQAASDNGRTRPVDSIVRDRRPYPIRPIPISKLSNVYSANFDNLTDEERLQVIRKLFPEGLPIKPIGPIPIIPAEKESALVFEHEDSENGDIRDEEQKQPISPIESQEDLPQFQPIMPL